MNNIDSISVIMQLKTQQMCLQYQKVNKQRANWTNSTQSDPFHNQKTYPAPSFLVNK